MLGVSGGAAGSKGLRRGRSQASFGRPDERRLHKRSTGTATRNKQQAPAVATQLDRAVSERARLGAALPADRPSISPPGGAFVPARAHTHTHTHSRERRPANRTQAHFALSGASRRLVCSLDYGASARRRTSTQTNRQRRRSPMCAQTRAHSVALVCAGACAAASTFLSAGARRASLIVRQVHQRSHPSQTTTSTARHRHRHQRR